MRRCMACRTSQPKQSMLRLVVDDDGLIWPDVQQQAPGRGVYHCMSVACLGAMNDKRLNVLKAHFSIRLPQWNELLQRMQHVLEQQLARMFTRQRSSAAIGRDAVMHRLWNNTPLLLLRAADAGEALVRQLEDGLQKRAASGCKSEATVVASRLWLGEMCGREDVAVVAMDAAGPKAAITGRLNEYCIWLERVKQVQL